MERVPQVGITFDRVGRHASDGTGCLILRISNRFSIQSAGSAAQILGHCIVACPGCYWGNNPYLTCLLTPEAAGMLGSVFPDGIEVGHSSPVYPSPDGCVTRDGPDQEAVPRRWEHLASEEAVRAIAVEIRELLRKEPSTTELRRHIRETLHARGLSMRHTRVLLERAGDGLSIADRQSIVDAMSVKKPGSLSEHLLEGLLGYLERDCGIGRSNAAGVARNCLLFASKGIAIGGKR